MTSKRNRAACFPTNRRRGVRHRTILPVCFLPYAGYYSTNPVCYTPNTHNNVVFLSTVQKLQKRILDFRHFHQKQARNFGFVHILYVFAKELLCVCKRQNRKNTQKYCFCQTLAVRKPQAKQQKYIFWAISHNSKCRYGARGAADAKPKAQIILDVLSSILATQMPCRTPSRSEALRSATAACGGSWRGDPPERCLSRKAGIVRCCLLDKNRKFRLLQPLHGQGYALFGGVHAQDFDAHNIAHLQSLARVLDKFIADL